MKEFQPSIHNNQLNLVWRVAKEPYYVMADRARLTQVFSNLLDNAIKYTDPGGNIGIRTRRQDDQVIIEFNDSGIGIARGEQLFIFDRFYRSPEVAELIEGAGLGLSVVKSVVEQYQGRVWVTSAPEIGSTFSVVLPLAEEMPDQ